MADNLTTSNVDNLPMFNTLSVRSHIPYNTIFGNSVYFQAQGENTEPRRNKGTDSKPHIDSLGHIVASNVCWDGYQNV